MYKGEVNVKQAELTKFMKIAESLKIKGLTTFNNLSPSKTPDEKIKPENSQNDSDKSKIFCYYIELRLSNEVLRSFHKNISIRIADPEYYIQNF